MGDDIKNYSPKMDKAFYDCPVRIMNCKTETYLQLTKQNRFPHLAATHQTDLYLKLYRKGRVTIEDLWITNEPSNFLENGDLVLLQNSEKTHCLSLELKSELFIKNVDLKSLVNRRILEV